MEKGDKILIGVIIVFAVIFLVYLIANIGPSSVTGAGIQQVPNQISGGACGRF